MLYQIMFLIFSCLDFAMRWYRSDTHKHTKFC